MLDLQPLEALPAQVAFDVVELMAAAVNATSSAVYGQTGSCSGLRLADFLSNRTFELTTGSLYINAERVCNVNLNIFGFNTTTKGLQVGALTQSNWIIRVWSQGPDTRYAIR